MGTALSHRRALLPSTLIGIGLGGFLDGIVLHQILQWHHIVSSEGCCSTGTLAGIEDNTLADGIFHATTWLVTLIGTLAAVRAWRRGDVAPPWGAHFGCLLVGWGFFNVIDSANHFLLDLHHIRDDLGGPVGWDIGFLALAFVLIALGWAIVRASPAAGLEGPTGEGTRGGRKDFRGQGSSPPH
jgi:uncharacterized membrane protein